MMTCRETRPRKRASTKTRTKAPAKRAARPAAKKTARKSAAKAAVKAPAVVPKAKAEDPVEGQSPGSPWPCPGKWRTAALDETKGQNVTVLDVRGVTSVADTIVIASGTSDRHVKSLATRVQERAREAGQRPARRLRATDGEWVLVDLGDVIVHVMLPRVREFYALESSGTCAPRSAVGRRGYATQACGRRYSAAGLD
jgi:ribosome-associated protein